MESTELESALIRHDRRRSRSLLVATLALLAGVCFCGGMAIWARHKEESEIRAVETARLNAEAARLSAIESVNRLHASKN